jgi:glycerophosphoryl diester phosphodiesterase
MHKKTNSPHDLMPLVIAHRGARAFAPENTLEAIDKAAALGADMVEIDVQLAADASLVVVHDDTLERCSDVRDRFPNRADYRVTSFTTAEIAALDAGSWFIRAIQLASDRSPRDAVKAQGGGKPLYLASLSDDEAREFITPEEHAHYASGGVRHPTLEEALGRCFARGLAVNIELKSATGDCSQLVEPVLATVDRLTRHAAELSAASDRSHPVLISSFDHGNLRRVKELRPEIPIGVLVAAPLDDPVAYCRELGAEAYHPGCAPGSDAIGFSSHEFRETGRLPDALIRALTDAGIAVNVWTENDPVRMRALIAAGVTGIFTDFPNRLVALRAMTADLQK